MDGEKEREYVCVCVKETERERDREGGRSEREREIPLRDILYVPRYIAQKKLRTFNVNKKQAIGPFEPRNRYCFNQS